MEEAGVDRAGHFLNTTLLGVEAMSNDNHSEEWRDVSNYEGLYQVSNLGRVRTVERIVKFGVNKRKVPSVFLTPLKATHGHLKVSLSKNGKMRHRYIHRLVLLAFVGPCPKGMECRHFPDRDPTNNNLANLQWGTSQENSEDSVWHGTSPVGERNAAALLTKEDVSLMRELRRKGWTQKSLAKRFKVSRGTVQDDVNYRTWKHLP